MQQQLALEMEQELNAMHLTSALTHTISACFGPVAAGLGLPHNPLSTVLARRDKAAMKEASCNFHGEYQPPEKHSDKVKKKKSF